MRDWTVEEIRLLESKYYISSKEELISLFNRSWSSIEHKALKLKLSRNNQWTEYEDKRLIEKYQNSKIQDLLILFPSRTYNAILHRAYKLRLIADQTKHKRKNNANDDFFRTPNLLNSYWAGFIAADGCIQHKDSSDWLSISIHKNDAEHLQRFCNDVDFTGDIKYYYNICRINIFSKKICEDLYINFNITLRKSLTLKSPQNLTKEQSLAFIIGYIDGDGCISIKDNRYINLAFIGTDDVLNWIKNIFETLTQFPTHCPRSSVKPANSSGASERGKIKTHLYAIAGKHALEILKILNEYSVPKMNRKWNKLNRSFVFSKKQRTKKDKCRKGHLYTQENTYITKSGDRRCRECAKILDRKRIKNRCQEILNGMGI